MSKPLLQLMGVDKSYWNGVQRIQVLNDLSMSVEEGQMLAVVGRSGSGKTTLLNIIGGMDQMDRGTLLFRGEDVAGWRGDDWDLYRQKRIGFVFQFNQLLPEFNALENVVMKGLINGRTAKDSQGEAADLLARLGLDQRLSHKPAQLSGGEQQRVAIARALMNQPDLILADEPTGNLDLESGEVIFRLLSELQRERGIACLLVTHNPELAGRCDRMMALDQAPQSAVEQGVADV